MSSEKMITKKKLLQIKTSISLTQWYPPPGKNTLLVVIRIHGRIVVNACVKYRKQIFIGVGDIHPDGQNFQVFYQFEQTKMALSQPFLI